MDPCPIVSTSPGMGCMHCDRMAHPPTDAIVEKTFYTCALCDKFHEQNCCVYVHHLVHMTVVFTGVYRGTILQRPCPKCANPDAVFYGCNDSVRLARVRQLNVCANRYCRKIYRVEN